MLYFDSVLYVNKHKQPHDNVQQKLRFGSPNSFLELFSHLAYLSMKMTVRTTSEQQASLIIVGMKIRDLVVIVFVN